MTIYRIYQVRKAFGFEVRNYYCTASNPERAEQMRAVCDNPKRGYRGEIVLVETVETLGQRWAAA